MFVTWTRRVLNHRNKLSIVITFETREPDNIYMMTSHRTWTRHTTGGNTMGGSRNIEEGVTVTAASVSAIHGRRDWVSCQAVAIRRCCMSAASARVDINLQSCVKPRFDKSMTQTTRHLAITFKALARVSKKTRITYSQMTSVMHRNERN
jgi:hypothetical protein